MESPDLIKLSRVSPSINSVTITSFSVNETPINFTKFLWFTNFSYLISFKKSRTCLLFYWMFYHASPFITFRATGVVLSKNAFWTWPNVPDPMIYCSENLFQSKISILYYGSFFKFQKINTSYELKNFQWKFIGIKRT